MTRVRWVPWLVAGLVAAAIAIWTAPNQPPAPPAATTQEAPR